MTYTIGEMAKLLNIAPSTLRYYDKEGLLPFVERSHGGIRLFKEADYEFLQIIGCLKSTGMQLKDIKEFISMVQEGDESIERRLELFHKQKKEVERQMEALRRTLDMVKFKCWYYEAAKKGGTTSIPEQMTDEELPEDIRTIRTMLRGESREEKIVKEVIQN